MEVNPGLTVSFLGCSKISVVTVWETPVTPFTPLNTLILEFEVSTFNTFIVSVPIPRISLDLILGNLKSPKTSKWVTIPVAPSVPIATAVVPTPATVNILELIPTL